MTAVHMLDIAAGIATGVRATSSVTGIITIAQEEAEMRPDTGDARLVFGARAPTTAAAEPPPSGQGAQLHSLVRVASAVVHNTRLVVLVAWFACSYAASLGLVAAQAQVRPTKQPRAPKGAAHRGCTLA